MGALEVTGLIFVALNVIWGLVYLVSKGFSAEAIAVMTSAVAAVSTLGGLYLRSKSRGTEGDGGQ